MKMMRVTAVVASAMLAQGCGRFSGHDGEVTFTGSNVALKCFKPLCKKNFKLDYKVSGGSLTTLLGGQKATYEDEGSLKIRSPEGLEIGVSATGAHKVALAWECEELLESKDKFDFGSIDFGSDFMKDLFGGNNNNKDQKGSDRDWNFGSNQDKNSGQDSSDLGSNGNNRKKRSTDNTWGFDKDFGIDFDKDFGFGSDKKTGTDSDKKTDIDLDNDFDFNFDKISWKNKKEEEDAKRKTKVNVDTSKCTEVSDMVYASTEGCWTIRCDKKNFAITLEGAFNGGAATLVDVIEKEQMAIMDQSSVQQSKSRSYMGSKVYKVALAGEGRVVFDFVCSESKVNSPQVSLP